MDPSSGGVRASPAWRHGSTLYTGICVAFYAAAVGRRWLRASSAGCGGAAAAFPRQDGNLRPRRLACAGLAGPAARWFALGPPRRWLAHWLRICGCACLCRPGFAFSGTTVMVVRPAAAGPGPATAGSLRAESARPWISPGPARPGGPQGHPCTNTMILM